MSGRATAFNDLINFFPGHPTTELLPKAEIKQATVNILTDCDNLGDSKSYFERHPLNYGTDEGEQWIRQAIANWQNKYFKLSAVNEIYKPDFINLTNGSSYGLLNILLQCSLAQTGYTKQAFIVTPTYFLINDCFIDAGFSGKITALDEVPVTGIDLKFLECKLKEFSEIDSNNDESKKLVLTEQTDRFEKKIYKFVIWLVPSFSNPGGLTLSKDTKLKLIELARKYDMLIITDDVYDMLDYRKISHVSTSSLTSLSALTEPLLRMDVLDRCTLPQGYNGHGNTISNASFSKIIAPGLRCGWQTSVNKKLVYQLSQGGANTSGGTPSHFTSNLIGNLITTGAIDSIIERFVLNYGERMQVLVESIKQKLYPMGFRINSELMGNELFGGYFIWVVFPKNLNAKTICDLLRLNGVNLANGSYFEVSGNSRNWGEKGVRLLISKLHKDEITKGINIWADICQNFLNTVE